MPSVPTNPGNGLRQQRAAELRAQAEAARQSSATSESPPNPNPETPASAEEFQGAGPVGQGDYVVKQGDCISSIAKDTGHFWETIWNDPANSELKTIRNDPNVLLPHDRVTLPAKNTKEEPGETEMRHRFVRRGEPSSLVLHMEQDGKPRANVPYTLTIDQQTFDGVTDAEGKIEVVIPNNARRGRLLVGAVPEQDEYVLALGQVDPIDAWSGVQVRLNNLGYGCEETEHLDEQTREALNAFRAMEGLERSDDIDAPTRAKLMERHGC